MARFEDFIVTFDAGADGVHGVSIRSPAGPAKGRFRSPLEQAELGGALTALTQAWVTEASTSRTAVAEDADAELRESATDVGVQLYHAVFSGEVNTRFWESVRIAEGRGKALRIRMLMDLDDPAVAPLASLPWELLRDPVRQVNLAEWATTSVVRHLDVPLPSALPRIERPLRVLFVLANPRGDLHLEDELRGIESRVRESGSGIYWRVLDRATYRSLEEALHGERFHILHFMGHGGFDGGDGGLLFEREGGGAEVIKGSELARLLMRHLTLRLVVLNACRTAESMHGPGINSYGGVAPALVMAGIPAVVAMQRRISDDGASVFADRLYRTLAGGGAIEDAVQAGRSIIRQEWATPVLFSRSDESLFELPSAEPPLAMSSDELILDPFMNIDRTDLVYDLEQAILQLYSAGQAPLVAIIPGNEQQCHDALQSRLSQLELPAVLKLDARWEKINTYRLEWPQRYRGAVKWRKELSWLLARQVQSGDSPEEMQLRFDEQGAPVMIYSVIGASEWARYGSDALEDYITFWRSWPAEVAAQRLFVFLFIKTRIPEWRWGRVVAAFGAWWSNAVVNRSLNRVRQRHEAAKNVVVLPTLTDIGQEHVAAWNDIGRYRLPPEEISRMFQEHFDSTRQTAMSMEAARRRLDILLKAKLHPAGGAA